MTSLSIVTYPHKALATPAVAVEIFDDALRATVKEMIELMYQEHGVGLAAPQVGLSIRLFVMDTSEEGNEARCLINPRIIQTQGECDSEEGCLSVPGVYVKIKRAATIEVSFQDESGQFHQITAEGLMARAIQHEIDHLDGVVLLDRLSKLKRSMALKKMQKKLALED